MDLIFSHTQYMAVYYKLISKLYPTYVRVCVSKSQTPRLCYGFSAYSALLNNILLLTFAPPPPHPKKEKKEKKKYCVLHRKQEVGCLSHLAIQRLFIIKAGIWLAYSTGEDARFLDVKHRILQYC